MIRAIEHHERLLELWREADARGIRLAHVDFHDDMRGLLIDRSRSRAHAVGAMVRERVPVDAGNFLAHAVLEGRVERVRWVHGRVGGRAWDMGIVRFETDLFALPERLRHRFRGGREVPLDFEELLLEDWSGPQPDETLSVDWDCFASILLEAATIGRRVGAFLERLGSAVPQETVLVYSPEYSHPSLEAFGGFAAELAERFGQPVVWLSPGLREGRLTPRPLEGLPHRALDRLVLGLRRLGVY